MTGLCQSLGKRRKEAAGREREREGGKKEKVEEGREGGGEMPTITTD